MSTTPPPRAPLAELLASERAHQDNLGSAGESSSAASTATMTNSSASSIGTLGGGGGGGGGGGFTGGLGSAGAKGDEDAIAGLSDPALSKSRVVSEGGTESMCVRGDVCVRERAT